MIKKAFLKIDKPCTENWDNMKPNDKGRFCSLCSKTVIDFIQLNQYEIANEMKKSNGNLCVRVTQRQLDMPLLDFQAKNKNPSSYSIATGLLIAATLSVGQSVQAQGQGKNNKIETIVNPFLNENKTISEIAINNHNPGNFTIIKGKVCTENGLPIKNAKITFVTEKNDISIYTLKDGTYTLPIATELIEDKIVIRVTYYEIEKKSVKLLNYQDYISADYVLKNKDFTSFEITARLSDSVHLTMGDPSYNIFFESEEK